MISPIVASDNPFASASENIEEGVSAILIPKLDVGK